MIRNGLSAFALLGAVVLAACSGPASLSPTGPTGVAAASALTAAATGDKFGSTGAEEECPATFSPAGDLPPVDPCDPPVDPCEAAGALGEEEPPTCEPPPPPPGLEGCTPGYWKNHPGSWAATGYSSSQTLISVFGANALPGTLLQGLNFGGGSGVTGAKQILLRAAVAALLNNAHPGVDYPGDVVGAVMVALGSDRAAMLALAAEIDADNNLGCPLN